VAGRGAGVRLPGRAPRRPGRGRAFRLRHRGGALGAHRRGHHVRLLQAAPRRLPAPRPRRIAAALAAPPLPPPALHAGARLPRRARRGHPDHAALQRPGHGPRGRRRGRRRGPGHAHAPLAPGRQRPAQVAADPPCAARSRAHRRPALGAHARRAPAAPAPPARHPAQRLQPPRRRRRPRARAHLRRAPLRHRRPARRRPARLDPPPRAAARALAAQRARSRAALHPPRHHAAAAPRLRAAGAPPLHPAGAPSSAAATCSWAPPRPPPWPRSSRS
jgi:hypothetical protein